MLAMKLLILNVAVIWCKISLGLSISWNVRRQNAKWKLMYHTIFNNWSYIFANEIFFIVKRSQKCFIETFTLIGVRVIAFSATLNNISGISWRRSALLVEETEEDHRPAAGRWYVFSHNVVSSTPRQSWIRTRNVSGDNHWLHR
jgi:hypothetical protein